MFGVHDENRSSSVANWVNHARAGFAFVAIVPRQHSTYALFHCDIVAIYNSFLYIFADNTELYPV